MHQWQIFLEFAPHCFIKSTGNIIIIIADNKMQTKTIYMYGWVHVQGHAHSLRLQCTVDHFGSVGTSSVLSNSAGPARRIFYCGLLTLYVFTNSIIQLVNNDTSFLEIFLGMYYVEKMFICVYFCIGLMCTMFDSNCQFII